jgi:ureidoacrylate peracid hydrolase
MLDTQLNFDRAALLLLDVQKGFMSPESPFIQSGLIPSIAKEREEFIAHAQSVLNAMRQAGRPVFYINTGFRVDKADCFLSPAWKKCLSQHPQALAEGSDSAAVIEELRPKESDFIIVKKGHSGFQFTHLDRALAELNVETCVVAGNVLSSFEETLRQGAALGYENILISDASFPLRFPLLKTLTSRTYDVNTTQFLQWAALPRPVAPARQPIRPCLLIIDIQNDLIHPEGAHVRYRPNKLTDAQRQEIIGNNVKLSELIRAKGLPVVYIKSVRGKDRFIDTASAKKGMRQRDLDYRTDGTWGAEVVDELKPQPCDYVIGKRGHSAFGTTHLHRMLRNLGVNHIIVTGGSLVGCVADSTREGVGLGYQVTLVRDAAYPPELRELGTAALATRLDVRTTEEVLAWLEKGEFRGERKAVGSNMTSTVESTQAI